MKTIKYRGYKIVHPIGSDEWSVITPYGEHLRICDTRQEAKSYIDSRLGYGFGY